MPKTITWFKTGAWILIIAGFAHTVIAVLDTWWQGAFSPTDAKAITILKNTTLGIAEFMKGDGTAVFPSAWGAYIGFAIAVGLLTGFMGLVFLLISMNDDVSSQWYKPIALAAAVMSGLMTVIGIFFYFYFPTAILAAGFICFLLAVLMMDREVKNAAR